MPVKGEMEVWGWTQRRGSGCRRHGYCFFLISDFRFPFLASVAKRGERYSSGIQEDMTTGGYTGTGGVTGDE